MPADAEALPPCPITGAPALERLQWMPAKVIHDLWRHGGRVDPAPLRRDSGRIGLYRSAAGLAFFHPAFEGSAAFYEAFYSRWGAHDLLDATARARPDHGAVAALALPGMRVLEVGCGHGLLARRLPAGVAYQGLEPHGRPPPGAPPILAERVAPHAARLPGHYDIACAFHVLEHVADPRGLVAAMLAGLKPGGRLVLAVPAWPSVLTELPNNLINLPPHHLHWWSAEALLALAAALGLEAAEVRSLPAAPGEAPLLWARRLCPVRTRPGQWLKPSWAWHLALFWGFCAGWAMARVFGLPRGAAPVNLLLVARKPGGQSNSRSD